MPASPLRSWIYLLFLGVVLLTLALVVRSGLLASKHFDEPINASMRAALAAEQPELSTQDALAIDRLYPTATESPSGLRFLVRDHGTGAETPRPGDIVSARYTGRLLDGEVFDSSDRNGGIFTFQVGAGRVIKGWDEAFLGMKKGEKRTLIVPWWLAYGEAGSPPVIPPRATLVFDVELVDFQH
jgi:FKBP-type peptidyl-prolyl cis-trans isomerase